LFDVIRIQESKCFITFQIIDVVAYFYMDCSYNVVDEVEDEK